MKHGIITVLIAALAVFTSCSRAPHTPYSFLADQKPVHRKVDGVVRTYVYSFTGQYSSVVASASSELFPKGFTSRHPSPSRKDRQIRFSYVNPDPGPTETEITLYRDVALPTDYSGDVMSFETSTGTVSVVVSIIE